MTLITRQFGPNPKGSKLTFEDMDNNLIYLKDLAISNPGPTGPQGIQGPQGTAGASVTILGSYVDLAAFQAGAGATAGIHLGDAWLLLSDGSLYSWNGSIWFDAGDIKGPPGAQGPIGPAGAQANLLAVPTNIVPDTDNYYTLGVTGSRWKSIHIGPGTIYITDTVLGTNAGLTVTNGVLLINGANQLQVGQLKFIDNTIESISGTTDIQIGLTGSSANLVLNRNVVLSTNKSLTFGDGSVQTTAYQAPYRVVSGATNSVTLDFQTDNIVHVHMNQGAFSITLTGFTASRTIEFILSIGVPSGSSVAINGISGSNVSNGNNVFTPLTKQLATFRFYCVDGTSANTFCVGQIS